MRLNEARALTATSGRAGGQSSAKSCAALRRNSPWDVDEFTAIAEKWGYWSDGVGELVPFCPECAKREFALAARASGHRLSFGIATAGPREGPGGSGSTEVMFHPRLLEGTRR